MQPYVINHLVKSGINTIYIFFLLYFQHRVYTAYNELLNKYYRTIRSTENRARIKREYTLLPCQNQHISDAYYNVCIYNIYSATAQFYLSFYNKCFCVSPSQLKSRSEPRTLMHTNAHLLKGMLRHRERYCCNRQFFSLPPSANEETNHP